MKPKQSGGTEFNDWIRLEDREPNDGQNVIAVGTWFGEISGCGESEYMGIGTWSGNIVSIDSDIYSTTIIDVTHWIPLPCYPTPYGEF
jgi:hypothetical protein